MMHRLTRETYHYQEFVEKDHILCDTIEFDVDFWEDMDTFGSAIIDYYDGWVYYFRKGHV